ncbi:MAG: hypothetical protein JNJ77_18755 [Planctomycetia bacterium]|nr:hypothetical protein [Planctomycetia bacterium]
MINFRSIFPGWSSFIPHVYDVNVLAAALDLMLAVPGRTAQICDGSVLHGVNDRIHHREPIPVQNGLKRQIPIMR